LKATLRIESLVHGGEGLARHEGRVVFVRGGAPGDLVEAELQGGSARFERTRALRVLEPGAAHVAAPCPIVDRCGGCPVQHVDSGAQLAAKSALTADALERIGGVAPGTYQVQLKVGDQTYSQSFELVKDPRVAATAEDLQMQFDLGRGVPGDSRETRA